MERLEDLIQARNKDSRASDFRPEWNPISKNHVQRAWQPSDDRTDRGQGPAESQATRQGRGPNAAVGLRVRNQGPLPPAVLPFGLPLPRNICLRRRAKRWTISVEMAPTSPQGRTCLVVISGRVDGGGTPGRRRRPLRAVAAQKPPARGIRRGALQRAREGLVSARVAQQRLLLVVHDQRSNLQLARCDSSSGLLSRGVRQQRQCRCRPVL
jgi:hypothetical protein